MNYFLVILLVFTFILSNLIVDILLTEEKLIIKLFGIKIVEKKGEKLKKLLSNLINKSSSSHGGEIDIIKNIEVIKMKIVLKTIVNNYNIFLFSNQILDIIVQYVYSNIKNYIPNFYYCYKEDEKNAFKIDTKLKINVFVMLLSLMKGKKKYGTKRN